MLCWIIAVISLQAVEKIILLSRLFAVAVILSIMGATYFTVLAFLAPITMVICDESKMDKLTGAIAINAGALCGGDFPTSNLGVIFRGLADTAYEANKNLAALDTFAMEMEIFLFSLVFSVLLITIFKFGVKANRNIGEGVVFKKPEAFTGKQKTTLTLMIVMMIVVLAFPLLKIFMPSQPFIKYMAGKIDVGLVAIIFAVIALPNFGNALINLMKEGALAYTIGLVDLLGKGNLIIAQNYGAYGIEIYLACLLIYWAMTSLTGWGIRRLEEHLNKGGTLAVKKERAPQKAALFHKVQKKWAELTL